MERVTVEMDREHLLECQISIQRAFKVIKNKDSHWTDQDIMDELENALDLLKKAGYTMTKEDFSLNLKYAGLK